MDVLGQLIVVAAIVFIAFAAVVWGFDSRDPSGDGPAY